MTRTASRRHSPDEAVTDMLRDVADCTRKMIFGLPVFDFLPCLDPPTGRGCGCGTSERGDCGCDCGHGDCGHGDCGCGDDDCGSCCGEACEPDGLSFSLPGCATDPCGGEDPCWPCWMPKQLAPINQSVCPGSSLKVKFIVLNKSMETRTFIVAATGPDAGLAKGAPSTIDVGPMGCGELAAIIHVPEGSPKEKCGVYQLNLWVRGCNDYLVKVCIKTNGDTCGATAERCVVEQLDTCHTWRDHFYVSRPCLNHARRDH